MDWSKAKTILIIAFFLLNIFLLVMIVFANLGGIFQNDYVMYANNYLISRDIKIKADIPQISGSAGKVLYATKEYSAPVLSRLVFGGNTPASIMEGQPFEIIFGSERITLSEEELFIVDSLTNGENLFKDTPKFERELYKYLNKLGYKKSSLVGGEIEVSEKEKVFQYTVKYKKSLIFDLLISVRLNNDGIMTLSIPTKEVKKENGKNEIISAHQLLVTAGLPPGTGVETIEFGYKQISKGDLYGHPVWRIVLEDETSMYYNAFTGESLKYTEE